MSTGFVAAAERARPSATYCGKNRNKLRSTVLIAARARRLWPRKTAAEVAARTGVSVRTAEYWLASVHEMPPSAVFGLLTSDSGSAFLDVLTQAMPAAEWRVFSREMRAELRRELLSEMRRT